MVVAYRVWTGWGRGGFDRRSRAVRRLVVLLADVERREQVGQQPQDVDDCQFIGGIRLEGEENNDKEKSVIYSSQPE